jgi:carbon monoxide dehydrogenase subunit G
MSVMNVLIERPPAAVWAVLADGHSYAEWVVGTKEIHEVDEHWPAVGSTIQFTAGVGPVEINDRTVVRHVEPERSLELEAQARWMGTARISFDLRPWGDNTLVIIDEHPLTGPGARLHNAAVDLLLHVRNRKMVRALARAVERRS